MPLELVNGTYTDRRIVTSVQMSVGVEECLRVLSKTIICLLLINKYM